MISTWRLTHCAAPTGRHLLHHRKVAYVVGILVSPKGRAMLPLPYPVDRGVIPEVNAFHDPQTGTVSYVVKDPASPNCAIIDPVMDFDFAAGRISFHSADAIVDYVRAAGRTVEWLIETHAHADHLSASPYIKDKLGGKIGIGDNIRIVQEVSGKIFNEGTEFQRDGSQFDRLFRDGET